MKVTLQDPRFLKDSILILSELVNEVNITFDKTKLEIIAMDPANVAMVIFKLLNNAFSDYNVPEPRKLSVSLDQLKQILKRAKPTDTLTLELDEEKNKLKVLLKGEITRRFNLSLLDHSGQDQKIPNLEFPLKIETSTLLFNEAIEDMDIIGDSVSFIVEGADKFIIQSEGNLSSGKVEITTDHETNIINNHSDEIKSNYSIEYLKKIVKGGKLSNTAIIQFGNDYPLKVEFLVLDKLRLGFILAPRVSND